MEVIYLYIYVDIYYIYVCVDLLFQCAITLAISGGMHRDFAVGLILLSGSCC